MKGTRLCALLLLCVLLLTGCTASKTAHAYDTDTHAHVYGNRYDVVAQTCLTAGTVVRYCKICHGSVTESVAVPTDIAARVHTFSDTVVAPTESTEGYTVRRCTLCTYVIERAFVVPAKYVLLQTAETQTVAPVGAQALVFSDTDSHMLYYDAGRDTAVPADVACRLATALTLADELTRESAVITPDTAVAFGSGNHSAKRLLFAYIEHNNTDALRSLAVAISGSEAAFAELVTARLARLGVAAGVRANPFATADNTATLGAAAVLLARVLDEPLLLEGFGAAVGLQLVAGQSPLLYLASSDGTLRATALAGESGVRFALVYGTALPDDYENVLYAAC